jgi:peroxiredoxin
MAPDFRLESDSGEMISPEDYREKKNLVLIFFDAGCGECSDFLKGIADRYQDYVDANAEVLAIIEGSKDDKHDISERMNLPFPILADPDRHVLGKYADKTPAIFVTDRFGEIDLIFLEDHLPDQNKILDRLQLSELECPECGVPTWPT